MQNIPERSRIFSKFYVKRPNRRRPITRALLQCALNEYDPSDDTLPQFDIVDNFVQPLNAFEPIEVNEDGNDIVENPVQP
jgi:hypothetical protein